MTATTARPAGFNADELAAKRENAGVTAGGTTYKPVRKTTSVMRDVRKCGREQERLGRRAERLESQADALERQADDLYQLMPPPADAEERGAALEEQARELVTQADEFRDQASTQTFVMLAALLADDEGNHPDPGTLEAALDLADAQALATYLMPNEPEPDPTPPTGTIST